MDKCAERSCSDNLPFSENLSPKVDGSIQNIANQTKYSTLEIKFVDKVLMPEVDTCIAVDIRTSSDKGSSIENAMASSTKMNPKAHLCITNPEACIKFKHSVNQSISESVTQGNKLLAKNTGASIHKRKWLDPCASPFIPNEKRKVTQPAVVCRNKQVSVDSDPSNKKQAKEKDNISSNKDPGLIIQLEDDPKEMLKRLKTKHIDRPIIAHLNINFLDPKFEPLKT